MTQRKFNSGDIVKLKSGHRRYTVSGYDVNGNVIIYHDDMSMSGEYTSGPLAAFVPEVVLELAPDTRKELQEALANHKESNYVLVPKHENTMYFKHTG